MVARHSKFRTRRLLVTRLLVLAAAGAAAAGAMRFFTVPCVSSRLLPPAAGAMRFFTAAAGAMRFFTAFLHARPWVRLAPPGLGGLSTP